MNASVKTQKFPKIEGNEQLYVTIVTSKGTVNINVGQKTYDKVNDILKDAATTTEKLK